MEGHETKLDRKHVRHAPTKLVLSGQSVNKDDNPGLWLSETFLTSLQPMNLVVEIQMKYNVHCSKININ